MKKIKDSIWYHKYIIAGAVICIILMIALLIFGFINGENMSLLLVKNPGVSV